MSELTIWENANESALIEHILARYHQVHRLQLQDILPLAEKVSTVHAEVFPAELLPLLQQTQQELLNHMQKEELVLFPMILNGAGKQASMPIRMMRHEHDDHQHTVNHLIQLTNHFTPPENACQSWQRLYAAIAELCQDLNNHIVLENDILFPRVLS